MDNNNVGGDLTKKIIRAGMNSNTVNITYTDSKGNLSTREVEPYEVRGNSFFGYCLNKNSIRRFDFDKVRSAEITNNKFIPRWALKIQ